METASVTQKDRKEEIRIQDGIQRTIESRLPCGQKVLLWSQPKHKSLRKDPLSPTGELRSQIIMEDLLVSSDKAYGISREDIRINVMGLVSAMEQVNQKAFSEWLKKHPTVKQTVKGLAEIAAVHLADLFEKPPLGVNVSSWRLMLAFGEKQAWASAGKRLGFRDGGADPRVLTHIPGAPAGAMPLYYQPCWPARNNGATFLDEGMVPGWLPTLGEMMGEKALPKALLGQLMSEYMSEATRRRGLVQCAAPLAVQAACKGALPAVASREGQVNQHYWVREYHTPVGGVDEYPDFLLFVNGLPILWVEVKTRKEGSGLERGVYDFQTKPSYQGAALAVVTDGERAIVDARMVGELPMWVNYKDNLTDGTPWKKGDNVTHGSFYLFDQILSRPARTEFLLRHCGAFNQDGHYMTARSQQYQALAHLGRDLEWLDVCRVVHAKHNLEAPTLGNRLIQHTQRTGKTLTMVRSIHLAQGYFPELFRLSMIMVGEVDILKQIYNDITKNDFGLADQALDVCQAESKQGLKTLLENQSDGLKKSRNMVVLANMQKIDSQLDPKKIQALPDSKNVLVVLDEGHLAQTEKAAKARQKLLPHASNLLLTATPKTAMNEYYGLNRPWHRLDVFGFGVAQEAGIVCPVIYRRHPYSFEGNNTRIGGLVDALVPAISSGDLDLDQNALSLMVMKALGGEGAEGEETGLIAGTTSGSGAVSNAQAVVMARQLAKQVRRRLEQELIQERLDATIDMLERYEHALPRKDKKQISDTDKVGRLEAPRVFRPRALVFARDVQSALDIIQFIRDLNKAKPASEQNVYRGRRFAMDVADFGKDTSLADQQRSQSGQSSPASDKALIARDFYGVNAGITSEKELKKRLKSDDPAKRVDVLLAVGKYTKGYDNDLLALVVLLRNVAEPSLMNQIYTRPATKRDGKPAGVCLDLAFGMGNVESWRQSLRMFDQSSDRDQLYEEKDAEVLVEKVHLALERTAGSLEMSVDDLAEIEVFRERFEGLKGAAHEEHRRQFVVLARKTTSLIHRLPDASLYMTIQKPLRGLRDALLHVQQLFPELAKKKVDATPNQPDDDDDSGVIQGGHSPKALGDFIRNALEALSHPSLSNIFGPMEGRKEGSITGLLGIGVVGEAVDMAANVTQDQELTSAQQRQVLRAAERVLDAVIGASNNVGGDEKDLGGQDERHSSDIRRDPRGVTALTEALNRALDRIRDDITQLDDPKSHGRKVPQVIRASQEAVRHIGEWRSVAAAQGGVMQSLVYDRLSNIVDERLHEAGRLGSLDGKVSGKIVQAILTEASESIVSSFNGWFARLPTRQHDSPVEQLSENWLYSQNNLKLSDFLSGVRSRTDIHQLEDDEFAAAMVNSQNDLRIVLGSDSSGESDRENPLAAALAWALRTDASQQAMERFVRQFDKSMANEGVVQEGGVT